MSKKNNNQIKPTATVNTPAAQPQKEHAPKKMEQDASTDDASWDKLKGKTIYILLGALVLGCIIVFRDFITFEKTYLFKDIGSDSVNIYFPWLAHMADYVKANGVPTWSFSQGMGQNILPLWLGDFFADFLMLFNKEHIPYALAYIEMIKIVLCGLIFYKYLLTLKLNEYASAIGAFLFAFCGYIMVGGCWTIFSNEALYIALILYGFERWLGKGRWLWFTLGLTCMSLLQPFFLFMYAIFLAAYIPVRYNDVRGDQWTKFPLFLAKTLGLAVLGVALSAWQLFPDLLQYIESPRVGGEARLIDKLKAQPVFGVADEWLRFTTTFRAFGSDMLGTGSAFQGWQNYLEAPLFYCGILCLVTFTQVFTRLSKKQRIAYGILTGLFALPILFPFFRYTFWAYASDYFRTFSLVITLLLLIFSARALSHIIVSRKLNLIVLGVTVLFLLFLLFTPAEQFVPAINSGMRSTAALLIFLYSGILIGISRGGEMRRIALVALAVLCFGEMVLNASTTINDRDVVTGADLKEKIGFNDYTVDAVKYVKEHDKGFYRVNKDYSSGPAIHASINDAKVQGYFGTPSYYSFNQKNYIKFLADVGVLDPKDENATRWARGLMDRPLLFSMASGKYSLTRNPGQQLINFGYDSVAQFGNVKLFRNRYSMPLGFGYQTVMGEDQFKTLSPFQKDVFLLRGCVVAKGDDDLMAVGKPFNMADTAAPFSLDAYGQYVTTLKKDSMVITQFKESHIKGVVQLPAPEILFFSIPFDEGWHATVNGSSAKLYRVNCGLMGLKMPAGKSDVDLHFEPRYMKQGGIVSILAILVFAGLLFAGNFMGKKKEDTEGK